MAMKDVTFSIGEDWWTDYIASYPEGTQLAAKQAIKAGIKERVTEFRIRQKAEELNAQLRDYEAAQRAKISTSEV